MRDLNQLQEEIRAFHREHNLSTAIEARALDLVSEVGELCKEIAKATDYGNKPFEPNEAFMLELGDVFFSLICLANTTGMSLEDAISSAMAKYEKRIAEKGQISSEVSSRQEESNQQQMEVNQNGDLR
jgi:NTP pyrophosphatase (non-canonical NTP hydrolase)